MSKKQKQPKDKKQSQKTWALIILLLVLLAILFGLAFYLMQNQKDSEENTMAYTDLIKEISYGNIEKIEMTVGSTTVKVKQKNVDEEKTVIVPNTESFMELVQQRIAEGNEMELIQKPRSVISQIPSVIVSLLPTAIMLALFIMIFKMQGLGEKGKVYDDTERKTKVKFEDVIMNNLKDYKFPILKCDDFGHNCENVVIPIGGKIKLDATNCEVEILEKIVN